ncbi:tyrosine-type recombinase/integrase [Geobacter pickeringii]|uniref:Integrase n=1 Tax=Geobacter pickeringii TaxID=345632 RepID=A0A0B5BD66_9BACT|nr:site-specific integrase [Geobacter pickeringii]AJE04668.1 integrase [Geobacter pickeringii]
MTFSDKYIASLKPTDKINDVREGKGFGIRVLPSGIKTWFFIYRIDGKRRFMNLGHYPSISLQDARKKYRDAYGLYEQGKDPAGLADHAKEERRKMPTVADLVEEYIERHAKRFKRSWEKDKQILNRDVIPAWGTKKAVDVSKRDVVSLLEGIVERGAPAMANNCFQIIRKMFNWAVEKDILPSTPCTGVKLPSPKVTRERTLNDTEIKTMWGNLGQCAMSEEIERALKLILVTAQRPGEVIGMHSSEIDGQWWTIPAERAKNGKSHRVFLTSLALELIGNVEDKAYIFKTPIIDRDQPIGGTALNVALNRALCTPVIDKKGKPVIEADGKQVTKNTLGVDPFTPHDLRRTAATFMAEMGTMDEVIDAILNHAKKGVIKVYNQYRYDKEKQAALESWERKLKSIINGKTNATVTPISAGRKGRRVA